MPAQVANLINGATLGTPGLGRNGADNSNRIRKDTM
jgi:hypothetical protein